MKFTLDWLKEHLDTKQPVDEIAHKLTMLGLEVEEVVDYGASLKGYVVANVLDAKPHPDADSLQVLQVFDGTEEYQVVCGAPNARAGMKGIFGKTGMFVPRDNFKLKVTKIRGVESFGMMMSMSELCLSDESDGIIDVTETGLRAGTDAAIALDKDNVVIEIAITPNRGDCLGIRYVAHDLASAGCGTMKTLDSNYSINMTQEQSFFANFNLSRSNENACTYAVFTAIHNIDNKDTSDIDLPTEIVQRRLNDIGVALHSDVVDLANYLMYDLNQPFHIYDKDKITGIISIRMAKSGEEMVGIDGKNYVLDENMMVIADDEKVISIAGVMGGLNTAVSPTTKNIIVEAAYFNPDYIAYTGQNLGLISDSRSRFERHINGCNTYDNINRLNTRILKACGGDLSNTVELGYKPKQRQDVSFSYDTLKDYIGLNVEAYDQVTILKNAGYKFISEHSYGCDIIIPTWRHDIVDNYDLAGEVIRYKGYDTIEEQPLPNTVTNKSKLMDNKFKIKYNCLDNAIANGYNEVYTWSFTDDKIAQHFGGIQETLIVKNPISEDLSHMRTTLIGSLIKSAESNHAKSISNVKITELAPIYTSSYAQQFTLAGVCSGKAVERNWIEKERDIDFYDVKADVISVLSSVGIQERSLQIRHEASPWYHPGKSAAFFLGKTKVAECGLINPKTHQDMGYKVKEYYAFEIFVESLNINNKKRKTQKPTYIMPKFSNVVRDLAVILKTDVTATQILRTVEGSNRKQITDVKIFDRFQGGNLAADEQSIGISFAIMHGNKTLTDQEIAKIVDTVIEELGKKLGAKLR